MSLFEMHFMKRDIYHWRPYLLLNEKNNVYLQHNVDSDLIVSGNWRLLQHLGQHLQRKLQNWKKVVGSMEVENPSFNPKMTQKYFTLTRDSLRECVDWLRRKAGCCERDEMWAAAAHVTWLTNQKQVLWPAGQWESWKSCWRQWR